MPADDTPNTLSDGFAAGSYDIVINGFPYTMDTLTHSLPVSSAAANNADGTYKGGVSVRGQQRLAVRISAVAGHPAPKQLVPFAASVHGYIARNWYVATLTINSANTGASIRTYDAEILEYKASLVPGAIPAP